MIKADADALLTSMDKAIEEVKRKLKNLVVGFAEEATYIVSYKTPIGDADSLETNQVYAGFYARRERLYGIPQDVGYHQGNWRYSESDNLDFFEYIASPSDSSRDAGIDAKSFYKLGDSFYIANNGPGIIPLQFNSSNQTAGRGIIKPAVEQIKMVFAADLLRYYR
jgi:ABC-type Fe3+-hydroxamate transport system substrate-binding protein